MLKLELGQTAYGRLTEHLTDEMIERLTELIQNPSEENWDNAHSMVVAGGGYVGTTLWEAVRRVDPTFPGGGPIWRGGEQVSGWARVPDHELIINAIRKVNT